jgi:hypothetical protein
MAAFDARKSRLKELQQELAARISQGHGGTRAWERIFSD